MELVRAVILGSGSSSSTPFMTCATSQSPCKACADALQDPSSRNHRLNPSLLLQMRHPLDGTLHNVLIDCGKTFREAAIKSFPKYQVRDLSAVLLTHDHADACYGLDDLRQFNRTDDGGAGTIDMHADANTLKSMHRVFQYLFPPGAELVLGTAGAGSGMHYRESNTNWTASTAWHCMAPMAVTKVAIRPRITAPSGSAPPPSTSQPSLSSSTSTWEFVAVPVLHGPGYYSNAFLMRLHTSKLEGSNTTTVHFFLYMSDVSVVDQDVVQRIESAQLLLCGEDESPAAQLDVLVLDMTSWNQYISHLSVEEALAAASTIKAASTVFVGLSHSLEYSDMMTELKNRGLERTMTMGYDGLVAWEKS